MPLPEFDLERANDHLQRIDAWREGVEALIDEGPSVETRIALNYVKAGLIQARTAVWSQIRDQQARQTSE